MRHSSEITGISMNILVPVLLLLTLLSSALPIMTGFAGGSEASGELVIRGFNLAEFSPFGVTVIAAPILLAGIFYAGFSSDTKQLLVLLLWGITMFGVAKAIHAAAAWLNEISVSSISFSALILAWPVLFFLVSALAYWSRRENDSLCKACP